MDFTDLAGRYLQSRMDQATLPFTNPEAYANQRLGLPTSEDVNTEANVIPKSTTISYNPDGTQTVTEKKEVTPTPAPAPAIQPPPVPQEAPAPVPQAPVQQAPVPIPQPAPVPQEAPVAPVAPTVQQAPVQQAPVQQAPMAPVAPTIQQPPPPITPTPAANQILGQPPGAPVPIPQAPVSPFGISAQPRAPMAPPVPQQQPMIAGTPTSDVGLTPTEQAVKQMAPAPETAIMPKVIPGQHGMNLVNWQDQPEKLATIANDKRPPEEGGPTPAEKQLSNRLLSEHYNNKSKEQKEIKKGEEMVANNDERGIARVLTSKAPEGSYLKAYLYNRLGLTKLADQEQVLLGAGSTLQRVMLPDNTQALVRLRGDNVASYGVDTKTGKELSADQLAMASASYAKGAETGAAMYKTRDGHTISVTRIPGRVEPIFYDNTAKVQLDSAPLGMTPLGQKDSIILAGMESKKQVETDLRKKNNAADGRLYTEQQIQELGNNAFKSLVGYDYNVREHGVVSPQEQAVQNAPSGAGRTQQNLEASNKAITGQGEFTDPSIRVISAQRPTAQQQAIWDESVAAGRPGKTAQGNPIAKPGTSLHETDNARDIDASRLTKAGREELYDKGWMQPIPQTDPNHWERRRPAPAKEAPGAPTGVGKAIESTAQSIADYKGKPLTAGGAQGSYNQAVMARVRELNPNYDETKYKVVQEVRDQYTKVNPASAGGQLQAVNRAIPHLDQFKEAVNALDNGDLPLVNKITNLYGKNVGNDKVAAAKAIQNLVATEVQKAVAGGLGGVEERKDLANQLSTNMNPKQIAAVIDAYQNLMAAQAQGLKQNWTSNGLPASEFNDKLVPKAREVLSRHEKEENNKRSKW